MAKRKQEEKRLYKSVDDAILCGVCGGIAEYFGIEATLLRLALVVAALFLPSVGATLVVLYVIACIILPENPAKRKSKKIQLMRQRLRQPVEKRMLAEALEKKEVPSKKKGGSLMAIGLVMAAVGAFYLLWYGGYLPSFSIEWSTHWPIILIAGGLLVFFLGLLKKVFK